MTKQRTWISRKDFLAAWNGNNSIEEVADQLGISYEGAVQRFRNYRNNGVEISPKRIVGILEGARREFATIWNGSETVDDVARALSSTTNYASRRAKEMRARGVFLKNLPTAREKGRDDFISIWNDCATLEEASKKTGLSHEQVRQKYYHLKRSGASMNKKPVRTKRTGTRKFLHVWRTSASVEEVAWRCNISVAQAKSRADYQKKTGRIPEGSKPGEMLRK